MVDVICDTSFLIHLATKRIFNLDRLDSEIGQISFQVPKVVKNELFELQKNPSKKQDILYTLEYIKKFKTIDLDGSFADKEILDYIKENNVIVATMDKELKQQIKSKGRSIISFSNNRVILES
ncbi:MAG: twitching motility protein PilT [Nitrosopumilus sp. (ex Thoosa mismalolli)]|nr:twitching motility protein PilT [Nitrosopumilus sp. (ex Thoosa mismalolli)]